MRASMDLIDLCTNELSLCGVHKGESVAVLSAGEERLEYADAFLNAAIRLGASTFHVRLASGSGNVANDGAGSWTVGATGLAGNRGAVEALKQADLVIDLIFLLFSQEQTEIQESGTRILTCVEPEESLTRLFPDNGSAPSGRDRCRTLGESARASVHQPAWNRCHVSSWKLSGHRRIRVHRHAGPVGSLAVRAALHGW